MWVARGRIAAALMALAVSLALSVAAAPAAASTRIYSGPIEDGGTITIKATFEHAEAVKVLVSWSGVPILCDGSSVYDSMTSGTFSSAPVVHGATAKRDPSVARKFDPTDIASTTVGWSADGRFNESYTSAKGFFTWADIETDPSDPTGIPAECTPFQGAMPLSEVSFTATRR
jgi:hypothetical protein